MAEMMRGRLRHNALERKKHTKQEQEGSERALEISTEMARKTHTDGLTELLNREGIQERLDQALARSGRMGMYASALMIDIDNFKHINDTYGHAVGDTVLKEVARALNDNSRDSDDVGRYGGEEFLVVVQEKSRKGASQRFAEVLRQKIAELKINVEDKTIQVTISIGVAMRQNDEDATTLLAQADEALYKAKRAGRNRTEMYHPKINLFPQNGNN